MSTPRTKTQDEHERETLLGMAQQWDRLAEHKAKLENGSGWLSLGRLTSVERVLLLPSLKLVRPVAPANAAIRAAKQLLQPPK